MTYTEVLVISVGETPQVVTETLYHYTYHKLRKFDKVIMITTSKGRDLIEKKLFHEKMVKKLEKALSLKSGFFPFDKSDIVAIKNSEGKELDDVRTTQDCEDEMRQVFEIMYELTDDENNRLTVVIAGGRKTISATMALGTSLYGRQQDEMIHVLIPQELFSSDWFFPDDPNDPKQKIEVSQIPYLRTKSFIKGLDVSNPMVAIQVAQSRLDELAPITKVIIDGTKIKVSKKVYKLPPAEMQIWRYLAKKKLEQCERKDLKFCGSCNDCYSTHSELVDEFDGKIADEYFNMVKKGSAVWDNRKEIIQKRKEDFFEKDTRVRELKSKLKRNIRFKFSEPRIYQQLQIVGEPIKKDISNIGYGLKIDKGAIKFFK